MKRDDCKCSCAIRATKERHNDHGLAYSDIDWSLKRRDDDEPESDQ